jgi:hypothetical protein
MKCVPECVWIEFLIKCVPKYCLVQQQWVARLSLLRRTVVMGSLMIARRYWHSSSNGLLARFYCGASSNAPLMSECPSLLWALAATVRVPHVQ